MSLAWSLRDTSLGWKVRWHLFKSAFRAGDEQLEQRSAEHMERVVRLGDEIMSAEYDALMAAGVDGLFSDRTLMGVELQFLWGVFHELELEYPDMPTNDFDRIKVDLIHHLVRVDRFELFKARDEVNAVEDLYNRGDKLFSILSECGKEVYRDRNPGRLVRVVKAMHEGGVDKHDDINRRAKG